MQQMFIEHLLFSKKSVSQSLIVPSVSLYVSFTVFYVKNFVSHIRFVLICNRGSGGLLQSKEKVINT